MPDVSHYSMKVLTFQTKMETLLEIINVIINLDFENKDFNLINHEN